MKIGMIFAAASVLAALSAPCDIASDTWVATDGLGRSLPTAAEAGLPRTNRTVAVFYFINRPTDENVPGPFDVSKILSADPDALKKPDSPLWGPMYCNHWWGEPLFGYYCSNDCAATTGGANRFSATTARTIRSFCASMRRCWVTLVLTSSCST